MEHEIYFISRDNKFTSQIKTLLQYNIRLMHGSQTATTSNMKHVNTKYIGPCCYTVTVHFAVSHDLTLTLTSSVTLTLSLHPNSKHLILSLTVILTLTLSYPTRRKRETAKWEDTLLHSFQSQVLCAFKLHVGMRRLTAQL